MVIAAKDFGRLTPLGFNLWGLWISVLKVVSDHPVVANIGGTGGSVGGSPDSLGFLLWGRQVSIPQGQAKTI